MSELMTKPQLAAMLENLPARCAMDAVENIRPRVSPHSARFVLLNLELEGVVNWQREPVQNIGLTVKGAVFLKELKAKHHD